MENLLLVTQVDENSISFRKNFKKFKIGTELVSRKSGLCESTAYHWSRPEFNYFIGSKAKIVKVELLTSKDVEIWIQFDEQSVQVLNQNIPAFDIYNIEKLEKFFENYYVVSSRFPLETYNPHCEGW
jgi:hypothetical protein